MEAHARTASLLLIVLCFGLVPSTLQAQDNQPTQRDQLVAAARDIMTASRYCSFVTLDEDGSPDVRTMDPFAPETDMVVRFGSHKKSRKIRQIQAEPRVAVHYLLSSGSGYVTIRGNARIVDDRDMKARYWKEEWTPYYADREADYVLIEVTPETLEILDYSKGIAGDPDTWAVPTIHFPDNR